MEDQLMFKQVEVLLDIQYKKFMKEIQSLRDEVSQTREALERGLKEVNNVRQDPPIPSPTAQFQAVSAQVAQPVAAPPVQQFQPQTAANNEPIDRNDIAPADVSIEKIFYVGK